MNKSINGIVPKTTGTNEVLFLYLIVPVGEAGVAAEFESDWG